MHVWKTYRHLREIHVHFSLHHKYWKDPFRSVTIRVTHLFAKSRGFACRLCLLLSKLQLPNICHWKMPTWHNHWPLTLHQLKISLIYFNALSRRRDYFYWSQDRFPTHRIVVKPLKNLEFKGIFVSFLLSLNSLAAFHRQSIRQFK